MTSEWRSLSIPNVVVRVLDRFEDARGENVVLYDGGDLALDLDGHDMFVHDNMSVSYQHVLRGIHTDVHAWRMMTCVVGHVYFVVADCRDGAPFGRTEVLTLSDKTRLQVLLPPMVGAGFYVMSPLAVMHYKWSLPYDLSRQLTFRYDDPRFNIHWPVSSPILSERDSAHRTAALAYTKADDRGH